LLQYSVVGFTVPNGQYWHSIANTLKASHLAEKRVIIGHFGDDFTDPTNSFIALSGTWQYTGFR